MNMNPYLDFIKAVNFIIQGENINKYDIDENHDIC